MCDVRRPWRDCAKGGRGQRLRSVEWLQVGGQAYRLELQGLAAGDAYQALAGYVVQADAQELVLVGLPGF